MTKPDIKAVETRCGWAETANLMDREIYNRYHDTEWGIAVHDDTKIFEHLLLEGFQAGLSWLTILKKRENFRRAFAGFDAARVARFDKRKIARLLADPGIIRNRLKVAAAVHNARLFLKVQREFGSFDAYIWRFVGGKPKVNRWTKLAQLPARSKESDALSADLKARGFKFVGSTICYAHMQSTGLVNDHLVTCFRWRELGGKGAVASRQSHRRPKDSQA
jgi:DNA-3-methyladenine glycosylase I